MFWSLCVASCFLIPDLGQNEIDRLYRIIDLVREHDSKIAEIFGRISNRV